MTRDTAASPEALIKLLERQHALVEQLCGLAERQGALIERGESDALLTLLTQRQHITDQFVATQDDLARISEECRSGPHPVARATRDRIGRLVDGIGRRLGRIMEQDEADRERLEGRRDAVGGELAGLSTARAAHAAYASARTVTNRFADRQG